MKKYFNVKLEFDKSVVDQTIQTTIERRGKGYVCSIESNNLTVANLEPEFNEVVNHALINICDGSNLAKILGYIHGRNFTSYIGADLFSKYVHMKKYRQYFLGNTEEVLNGLRNNLSKIDPAIKQMSFETLPFKRVEDFDYKKIADKINRDQPDIIWVSLGAPKQEYFMSRLLPYLDKGIMFGFGAIFNFNAGEISNVQRAPEWMLKLNLEWLYRAFEEPKKNVPRYWRFIRILPQLVYQEKKNLG